MICHYYAIKWDMISAKNGNIMGIEWEYHFMAVVLIKFLVALETEAR